MGPGHPESPNRLHAIMQRLEESGTTAQLTRIEPRRAEDEWVTQVHSPSYVASLNRHAPTEGRVSLDPDTSMSPGSLHAAYLAAGGALAAVDAIMAHQVEHVFCAVRPPGHHAEAGRAMGFCLLNNVSIAARYVQKKYGVTRVLIVDWDVHHGNGTQSVAEKTPRLFFASTHQAPLYPGTGLESERGPAGNVVNAPLPGGADGAQWRAAMEGRVLPALDAFRPDLILVSAGFDAHRADPLAQLALAEEDFAWAGSRLRAAALQHCKGKLVSTLEGGYDLAALARSAVAYLDALQRD